MKVDKLNLLLQLSQLTKASVDDKSSLIFFVFLIPSWLVSMYLAV